MAMTREGDDMYDVGDTTLAASGTDSITVDGAMYHVWMDDGMLAGARYDDKQKDGRYNINIGDPLLSVQDDPVVLAALGIEEGETTVANELQTHLIVGDQAFSLGTLLGTGQASRVGAGQSMIVADALGEVRDLRQKTVATLDVFDAGDAGLSSSLTRLWTSVQAQVTSIFGDKVTLPSNRRDERILDDFDDIIAALSDADAFQAATAADGGGVFEDAALSADAAAAAFGAEKVEATATFGALGNTRFGAYWKKERDNAISKLADPAANALGAFAYGTTGALKTLRTRHVRQGTGNAFYAGRTEAVDGKGNFFSGDIEIQVRFAAEKVNAVITNLTGATGAWEYRYANTDVAEIILPDTRLAGNASWSGSDDTSGATVVYATRAGVPRPMDAAYTFKGQLLGRVAGDQGNEASGVWSLGDSDDGKNYLAGGFGAMRGADLPDIRPEPDSGEGMETTILPWGDIVTDENDLFSDTDTPDSRGQTIADGMLTVIGRKYDVEGRAILDVIGTSTVNEAKYRTHKIDLLSALDAGSAAWANGEKHVDLARTAIEKQLNILSSNIGLDKSTKTTAWTSVQDAILKNLFGVKDRAGNDVDDATQITTSTTDTDLGTARAGLPGQLGKTYVDSRNGDYVRAVEEVLDALESNAALKAALDVKGIFYREELADADPSTTGNQPQVTLADKDGKDNSGDGDVNMFDKVNSRVEHLIGSTDFTRFGAWRRQTSPNANEVYEDYSTRSDSRRGDGANALAYSQLAKTAYTTPTSGGLDSRFPAGARMTYEGSTVGVLGTIFIQGEIDVEVLWNSTSLGGKANISISEIENVANGERLYVDLDTRPAANAYQTDAEKAANALEELVSIDINNVDIDDKLALAAGPRLTSPSTVTVKSVGPGAVGTSTTRLHGNFGPGSSRAHVEGNFVGQGLGGPLAVLGTYWLRTHGRAQHNIYVGIGEMKPDDTAPDDPNAGATLTVIGSDTGTDRVVLHGGFGAEAP